MYMNGIGVSEGIGIGKAFVLPDIDFDTTKRLIDLNVEERRYSDGLHKVIEILKEKMKQVSGEQAEILESHIMILGSPSLLSEIKEFIISEKCNSEYALATVFDRHINKFSSSQDELLKLRASDLRDIKNNLLAVLCDKPFLDISGLPVGTILVAKELSTSMVAGIKRGAIGGIVTKIGGETSHITFIARSLDIPAIVGISVDYIENDMPLIVDGTTGELLLDPSAEQLEEYNKRQKEWKENKPHAEKFRGIESITKDGKRVNLYANISFESDIDHAIQCDAEGVGLFRTEFLYMNRDTAPDEEEQLCRYKRVAVAFPGKPVIIRTLDIGGDKDISYLNIHEEDNPYLGQRGIRYCLDNKEIFITQIRAIMRASAFGQVKILLPMVSTLEELKRTKALIDTVKSGLKEERITFDEEIPVGIMVETPAAAILTDVFVKEADFFSIGTNDLIQYTMAADRGNHLVANLYSPYDPAVMRLIYLVTQAATGNGTPCGVCGEAGSDWRFMKFLIGCGIQEFSMVSSKILQAKEIIRKSSYHRMNEKIRKQIYRLYDRNDAESFLDTL